MRSVVGRAALGIAVAAAAAVLAACSGTAHRGSPSSTSTTALRPALDGSSERLFDGRKGGMLTVYQTLDFSHFDPGEAYDSLSYAVIYATQRPLFSYLPNQPTVLTPDLASEPAIVSRDGRTVTAHIRQDVYFSPPVNREVTSADVAYAIERGANPSVACPYFSAYFADIVGASKATGGPIPGISTPNKYTIVFHLTGPFGTFFASALSLPLSAAVPREFAAPLDKHQPTTYGDVYLVSTGPYMIKSNKQGKILGIGYQPGESTTLVRNPNWNPNTDHRPAYLNRIEINIGGDPDVFGRQVLMGSDAVQGDVPTAPVVELAYKHYYHQIVAVPGTGVFFITLNNHKGPFSNEDLRKAVWAALDREEMIKVGGGNLFYQVGTHFIYPGSEGYQLAGGAAGPQVDYNMFPKGNPLVAAKYMKAAGYPSGKYTGAATLQVVGVTGHPYDTEAEIVNQTLLNLGFRTNLSLFSYSVAGGKFCGVPAQEIDVCPDGGWTRDFADPQTILDIPFAGYNITPENNSNAGQVNNLRINAAMRAAEQVVGVRARAAAWAKIDRMLVGIAAAIPWAFTKQPLIESSDVRGINDVWNGGTWDYSYTSLK